MMAPSRIAGRTAMATLLALSLTGITAGAEDQAAFEEVAAELGLVFEHFNGMTGKLYAAEHMGPAVALVDFDNDGDLDVYLGQGRMIDDLPPERAIIPPRYELPLTDRLYRNDLEVSADGSRRLRFTDVTVASGLRATGYNMGVATGDFDRDGWIDLYVTNLGSNHLLRNRGDGTFEDVTTKAGADDARLSVAASFFDYDGDGWLDLFVGNYNDFRPSIHKQCFMPQGSLDYCGPLAYAAEPDRLLRNRGDGSFEDVTARAGLADVSATALGSVAADFNGDGRPDLYVANDLMANHLWINQGDGRFVDDALIMGTALDGYGKPQASMGVVAGDLNGDGHIDLFMSHLVREMNTLYLGDGQGMFVDASEQSRLGAPSFAYTGFGTVMLDDNGDGLQDLYVVNGAVHRIAEQLAQGDRHPMRQRNQLFRGQGDGTFVEVPDAQRETPVHVEVSRGLAVGDLDNDGDPDLVLTNNAGPARLLLNRQQRGDSWIGLRLTDRGGKSDALGARAAVIDASSTPSWKRVHTDGSYAGASDSRLLFVLAEGAGSEIRVRVQWPDGNEELFVGLGSGRYHTLEAGAGRAPAAGPGGSPR